MSYARRKAKPKKVAIHHAFTTIIREQRGHSYAWTIVKTLQDASDDKVTRNDRNFSYLSFRDEVEAWDYINDNAKPHESLTCIDKRGVKDTRNVSHWPEIKERNPIGDDWCLDDVEDIIRGDDDE